MLCFIQGQIDKDVLSYSKTNTIQVRIRLLARNRVALLAGHRILRNRDHLHPERRLSHHEREQGYAVTLLPMTS